jgi:hypothetical protein
MRASGRSRRAKAASREEEALLGAKMVGRWPSGAPLALCPEQDDPDLGVDQAATIALATAMICAVSNVPPAPMPDVRTPGTRLITR